MIELTEGSFTNSDIASWLHITAGTLSKRKPYYMAILKQHCDCESIRGGVIISKVYKPFYVKDPKYQIIKEDVKKMWDPSGLDSCTRIAD